MLEVSQHPIYNGVHTDIVPISVKQVNSVYRL
jgi:hypothetical protein